MTYGGIVAGFLLNRRRFVGNVFDVCRCVVWPGIAVGTDIFPLSGVLFPTHNWSKRFHLGFIETFKLCISPWQAFSDSGVMKSTVL